MFVYSYESGEMVRMHSAASFVTSNEMQGRIAQSVTCLATDACLTADPGVAIRSRSGPIVSWRLILK